MQGLILNVGKLCKGLALISKVVLIFSVLITTADVIGRFFGRPITGTYELVAASSGIIFACSAPLTVWAKGHISVGFLVQKLSQSKKNIFNLAQKCLGVGFFLILGSSLIALGTDLRNAGETSVLIHVPYYPIAYVIGFCFYTISIVLCYDIIKILEAVRE